MDKVTRVIYGSLFRTADYNLWLKSFDGLYVLIELEAAYMDSFANEAIKDGSTTAIMGIPTFDPSGRITKMDEAKIELAVNLRANIPQPDLSTDITLTPETFPEKYRQEIQQMINQALTQMKDEMSADS